MVRKEKRNLKNYIIPIVLFILILGIIGVYAGVTLSNNQASYLTTDNITLNNTGVYYKTTSDTQKLTKTADVVVCKAVNSSDYLIKSFNCDVVFPSDGTSKYQEFSDKMYNLSNKGGGIIFIGPGIYNLSTDIRLNFISNISIIGSGIGVTTFINGAFVKNSNDHTYNIILRDFTIDKKNISGSGLDLHNNMHNVLLDHIEVKNTNDNFLVNWDNIDNLVVQNSIFIDGGEGSSRDNCAGAQNVSAKGISIWRNNYFEKTANSVGGGLLTTGDTGNVLIEGNNFISPLGKSYACVSIENSFGKSKDIIVKNNYAYGCGFNVGNDDNYANLLNSSIISGNKIVGTNTTSNASNCIISYSSLATITDNQCADTNYGIFVFTNEGTAIVSNNYVKNTNIQNDAITVDKGGIYISNSTYVILNGNNIVSSNAVMPYAISVTNNTKTSISMSSNVVFGTYSQNAVQIGNINNFTAIGNHFNSGFSIIGASNYRSFGNINLADNSSDAVFNNINVSSLTLPNTKSINVVNSTGSPIPIFSLDGSNNLLIPYSGRFSNSVYWSINNACYFKTGVNQQYTLYLSSGNRVGVRTIATPMGDLDINQTLNIRANYSANTCNTTIEGNIYYDGTLHKHRGCNGTDWYDLY